MQEFYLVKILFIAASAFIFTIIWTPALTHLLYKYKMGKSIRNTGITPIFSALHAHKAGTPTMGGVLVWVTALVFITVFFLISLIFENSIFTRLNFFSRSETLLPLGTLVFSGIVGLFDDWLDVRSSTRGGGGLRVWHRMLIFAAIAMIGAWWFYFKLGFDFFHIPFVGNVQVGWMYIPIFIFVIFATAFSVNETDGLDGLAGGVLLICFAAFGAIAYSSGKYDLATFCGCIAGALLAFLWFNINPARFYMGDTGSMSMGVTLGVIAMLTNSAMVLPVIGLVFVIESLSVIIQVLSKKLRNGKKVFLSAPFHHHLEAKGWSEPKIVMRFWVVAGVSAVFGLILYMIDRSL
jgi:phospho-N-acetylmuramoyl-pentapeptide-transferase